MMNIGAIVVTYKPDEKVLLNNIRALQEQTVVLTQIVIVDNGSTNLDVIKHMYPSVKILKMGENLGIAKAQNVGMQYLIDHFCEWVLTMDQDSVLPVDYIEKLLPYTHRDDLGIVSGEFVDKNWKKEKSNNSTSPSEFISEEVKEIIASGNMVRTQTWSKVSGYDEELFIDYVDFDFDYKLQRHGFKILKIHGVMFDHEIGSNVKPSWLRNVMGLRNRIVFDHSAMRMYFINRNRLIVRRRYPEFGSMYRMLIREIINLREIFIMGSPRFSKLMSALQGIRDGLLNKTGGVQDKR